MNQRGFTVIELFFAIVVLSVIAVLFWNYKNDIESLSRDDTRRTAINAMYYNLEDVYFVKNGHYPQTINRTNLTAMDSVLFTDPDGVEIGKSDSDYRYEPIGCQEERCSGYTLRAIMEREADYVKKQRSAN